MDIVNKLKKELLKQAFTEEQKQTERLNECKHIASIYAQTENPPTIIKIQIPFVKIISTITITWIRVSKNVSLRLKTASITAFFTLLKIVLSNLAIKANT